MSARDALVAYLRRAGLSTPRAEANLDAFAHELAEQIRAEKGSGTYEPGVYFRSGMDYGADIIDPQAGASAGPVRPDEEPTT